ncbi:unnamed protein product [Anisakis simplex]|uniref:Uncharacterized protein n=1 Tax=Anisakis simplex TaxID=6269 RepID=A0A158PNC8_ANISI|nr:unnamed protein product [Anisakis simplex]
MMMTTTLSHHGFIILLLIASFIHKTCSDELPPPTDVKDGNARDSETQKRGSDANEMAPALTANLTDTLEKVNANLKDLLKCCKQFCDDEERKINPVNCAQNTPSDVVIQQLPLNGKEPVLLTYYPDPDTDNDQTWHPLLTVEPENGGQVTIPMVTTTPETSERKMLVLLLPIRQCVYCPCMTQQDSSCPIVPLQTCPCPSDFIDSIWQAPIQTTAIQQSPLLLQCPLSSDQLPTQHFFITANGNDVGAYHGKRHRFSTATNKQIPVYTISQLKNNLQNFGLLTPITTQTNGYGRTGANLELNKYLNGYTRMRSPPGFIDDDIGAALRDGQPLAIEIDENDRETLQEVLSLGFVESQKINENIACGGDKMATLPYPIIGNNYNQQPIIHRATSSLDNPVSNSYQQPHTISSSFSIPSLQQTSLDIPFSGYTQNLQPLSAQHNSLSTSPVAVSPSDSDRPTIPFDQFRAQFFRQDTQQMSPNSQQQQQLQQIVPPQHFASSNQPSSDQPNWLPNQNQLHENDVNSLSRHHYQQQPSLPSSSLLFSQQQPDKNSQKPLAIDSLQSSIVDLSNAKNQRNERLQQQQNENNIIKNSASTKQPDYIYHVAYNGDRFGATNAVTNAQHRTSTIMTVQQSLIFTAFYLIISTIRGHF